MLPDEQKVHELELKVGLLGKDVDPPEDWVPPPAVYLSATFAKRPDNMPLYFRTALSRASRSFTAIVEALKAGGVALQQAISEALAKEGQYIRRERDFTGVSYTMKRVDVADPVKLVQQVDEFNRR